MLLDILGWFYNIIGVISLINPNWLRHQLKRKGARTLRRFFVPLALGLGILFLKAGWGYEGLAAKILVVLGILAVFKGFLLLNTKAVEKMTDFLTNRSEKTLRIFAVCYIVFGCFLIWVR